MEEPIRQIIETNFRLVSLSLREQSVRIGQMEATQRDSELAMRDMQTAIEQMQGSMRKLQTGAEFNRELLASNRLDLEAVADRLDEAVEAITVLAHASPEGRKRLDLVESRVDELSERLTRLEEAG